MMKLRKKIVISIAIVMLLGIVPMEAYAGHENPTGGTGSPPGAAPSIPSNPSSPSNPSNPSEGYYGGNSEYPVFDLPGARAPNCSCSGWSCITSYSLGTPGSTQAYATYNAKNQEIKKEDNSILAGTAIGVNAYEKLSVNWAAGGTATRTCTCTYKVQECEQCSSCDPPVFKCWTTTKTEVHTESSWSNACYARNSKLAYNAAKAIVERGGSYKIEISDPNDVRCQNLEKYGEQLKNEGYVCNNIITEPVPGNTSPYPSNPVTKEYFYERYGACMNVKTGKVRYLDNKCQNNNNCCDKDEYYIPNEEDKSIKHWHVFIPLNTKNTEKYKIRLRGKTIQPPGECLNKINLYPNTYMNEIKPVIGEFVNNIKIDKEMVSRRGCYYDVQITLETIQKFYNEVYDEATNTSSLQGFEFYYRPIDVNNPFPNGISDDSYWKVWSESKKNLEELKNSYDKKTYTAYNIDAAKVRKYNDKELYTSWTNMNIDGTSNYIKNEGIITRISETIKNDIYKLGCGPSNKDQEECK